MIIFDSVAVTFCISNRCASAIGNSARQGSVDGLPKHEIRGTQHKNDKNFIANHVNLQEWCITSRSSRLLFAERTKRYQRGLKIATENTKKLLSDSASFEMALD
ncbi:MULTISPECIES: hypothetical protein [Acidobacteriaceae]|uniref:hypothetical protein n=1 Tax=Acidobacteriaceae TaxID=204434 RepID=UPI00131E4271|nr:MULTISPECIES: hypothetical protein [Acidobacteriaceae]MDW5264610.1 hypothetical protein [Edaphobacter sp.]